MPEREDILALVVRALEDSSIPYMVTGSMASSFHGTPRGTQDIDIVIAPSAEDLERLISKFRSPRFYLDPESAHEALFRRSQFNLIEGETGWKVDFILQKNHPFNKGEFERRKKVDIEGVKAFLASAEDVIISKLDWAVASQSDRQIEDVAGIIKRLGQKLDMVYLDEWIKKLDLMGEWEKAKRFASR